MLKDDSIMPFGKHSGKPMRDVPATWLDWIHGKWTEVGSTGPRGRDQHLVFEYIKTNRDKLDEELLAEGAI